jgi:plasmid maintenance system killer protein
MKTHKLKELLNDRYSFTVYHTYRIVFQYLSKEEAVLLCIGDHDVYKV